MGYRRPWRRYAKGDVPALQALGIPALCTSALLRGHVSLLVPPCSCTTHVGFLDRRRVCEKYTYNKNIRWNLCILDVGQSHDSRARRDQWHPAQREVLFGWRVGRGLLVPRPAPCGVSSAGPKDSRDSGVRPMLAGRRRANRSQRFAAPGGGGCRGRNSPLHSDPLWRRPEAALGPPCLKSLFRQWAMVIGRSLGARRPVWSKRPTWFGFGDPPPQPICGWRRWNRS